jgi:hypothetical protein
VIGNGALVRVAGAVDHYLVCDRTGDCAVIEFLEGGTIWHTSRDLPVRTLTNHEYEESVRAWHAGRVSENSLERFAIAAGRVTAFRPTALADAIDYAFDTLERASGQATGGAATQWSIVFDAQNLQVHFRTSRNPEIRTIDMTRLDFGCTTPALMLDVHGPFSGDVTGQLEPFSFDANLKVTQDFIEKWGGGISPLRVEILERGLETYSCGDPAEVYQEERRHLASPHVGWAVRALVLGYWPAGLVLLAAAAAGVLWRGMRRRPKTHEERAG